MKKLISVLLSLVSVICIAFAFAGCGEKSVKGSDDSTGKDGCLMILKSALREEWLDEDDLKSIACDYYEWRNVEENPYSGLSAGAGQLSKETENKIKLKYAEARWFADRVEEYAEQVEIAKYYGTYNGNVVVTFADECIENYDGNDNTDATYRGVVFPDLALYPIRVYHSFEYFDKSLELTGRHFGIRTSYENNLISKEDLKSIACFLNDTYGIEENPYSGLYVPPAQKLSLEMKKELRQAYMYQIEDKTAGMMDDIIIKKYLGSYSGHIVVLMRGTPWCYVSDKTTAVEIDGVTLNYPGDCGLYVYYQYKK